MRPIIPFLLLFTLSIGAYGQTVEIKHASRDKDYIKDYYKNHLIIRTYESSRFNSFKLSEGSDKLVYKPNHHNDIGLGFTYRAISVNFEFFIPWFGQNMDKFGATHTFDLQTYVYIHKFVVDFYAQFYRGYYLANGNDVLTGNQPAVEKRPDISTKDISLICQYVFNDYRFSFNAPFYQNELQKKSAGSFLLGGGIYHNDGSADSSFIPSTLKDPGFFQNYRFKIFSYTGLGANVGYAYTRVIKKHFFITGSVSGGLGVGYAAIAGNGLNQGNNRVGMQYMTNGKFAAGYTNDKYYMGVTYVRLVTEINSVAPHTWEQESNGNFRFTIARRFRLKKSLIPKTDLIKMD